MTRSSRSSTRRARSVARSHPQKSSRVCPTRPPSRASERSAATRRPASDAGRLTRESHRHGSSSARQGLSRHGRKSRPRVRGGRGVGGRGRASAPQRPSRGLRCRAPHTNTTAGDQVAWVADNADAATPERLNAAAEQRLGRVDGALVSVGGTTREPSQPRRMKRGGPRSRASSSVPCALPGPSGHICRARPSARPQPRRSRI